MSPPSSFSAPALPSFRRILPLLLCNLSGDDGDGDNDDSGGRTKEQERVGAMMDAFLLGSGAACRSFPRSPILPGDGVGGDGEIDLPATVRRILTAHGCDDDVLYILELLRLTKAAPAISTAGSGIPKDTAYAPAVPGWMAWMYVMKLMGDDVCGRMTFGWSLFLHLMQTEHLEIREEEGEQKGFDAVSTFTDPTIFVRAVRACCPSSSEEECASEAACLARSHLRILSSVRNGEIPRQILCLVTEALGRRLCDLGPGATDARVLLTEGIIASLVDLSVGDGAEEFRRGMMSVLTGLVLPSILDTETGRLRLASSAFPSVVFSLLRSAVLSSSPSTLTSSSLRALDPLAILCVPNCLSVLLTDLTETTATLAERHTLLWEVIWNHLSKHDMGGMCVGRKSGCGSSPSFLDDDGLGRRRALHVAGLLLEIEGGIISVSSSSKDHTYERRNRNCHLWNSYVAAFQTFEMEVEMHLVDQAWPTLRQVISGMVVSDRQQHEEQMPLSPSSSTLPNMTWGWIGCLLARVLLSDHPSIRKLALYRFLCGDVGVEVAMMASLLSYATKKQLPAKGRRGRKGSTSVRQEEYETAPLMAVTGAWVIEVLLPSFNSILSQGTTFMFETGGKIEKDDLSVSFNKFLQEYVRALLLLPEESGGRLCDFIDHIWRKETICSLRGRTAALLSSAFTSAVCEHAVSKQYRSMRVISPAILQRGADAAHSFMSDLDRPLVYVREVRKGFAALLSCACYEGIDVKLALRVLLLYSNSSPEKEEEEETDITMRMESSVRSWLLGEDGNDDKDSQGPVDIHAAAWSFVHGCTGTLGRTEGEVGEAVVRLCSLLRGGGDYRCSLDAPLWDAVREGLAALGARAYALHDGLTSPEDMHRRALILLEAGCRLGSLSSDRSVRGGSDDKDINGIEPLPPDVEEILEKACVHLVRQIDTALIGQGGDVDVEDNSAKDISVQVTRLVGMLRSMQSAFPSSTSVASCAQRLFQSFLELFIHDVRNSNGRLRCNQVIRVVMVWAALACGATLDTYGSNNRMETWKNLCHMLLDLKHESTPGASTNVERTSRSLLQDAKWGALRHLLAQKLMVAPSSSLQSSCPQLNAVAKRCCTVALQSIASPADALRSLLHCVLMSASYLFCEDGDKAAALQAPREVVRDVLHVLWEASDVENNREHAVRLYAICGPALSPCMVARCNLNEGPTAPVREFYTRVMTYAGVRRPRVARGVVARMAVAWLGADGSAEPAVLYRDEIQRLLLYKEMKTSAAGLVASNREGDDKTDGWDGNFPIDTNVIECVPPETDSLSIVRGLVLVFLSKIPQCVSERVQKELIFPIMLGLLQKICARPPPGCMLMTGSLEYCTRIRGWQAMCLLVRFVTPEFLPKVQNYYFEALSHNIHGQIRYFLEIFGIQLARLHPHAFLRLMTAEMRRTDLSTPHMCSLMIVAGNLIVGRYAEEVRAHVDAEQVLSGTIPWLSSTQGFGRAIAQLMVYELIPIVLNVTNDDARLSEGRDCQNVKDIWNFLDQHPEMRRLRRKQIKFFHNYDAEATCTPEGLLSIPVDEGDEACPTHLVDRMKKCLEEVYAEAHQDDVPQWKQLEESLLQPAVDAGSTTGGPNFQRKILPLDALNLALEEYKDSRGQNGAGNRKRNLIVCASLIDKVPNLAGLARTSEIFAVDSLVVPDRNVMKLDNFKSISVGAGDWVDIKEVKEKDTLRWLCKKKAQGYSVVGLEQTASSRCITKMQFSEKTVLLLGREKEGIPVEYLQLVDKCVEIPQMGVIRSLNVHVSGAITIWEYMKQVGLRQG
uniref:tRNA/rRNA methyltransferase SpoU type domain-containing protein n=1 Tax=Corethron hystrix TaxID=216773 RepID=A0A7S1C1B8_9STRA|mmetsp:Transcript_8379/g.18307  ORF Transcript_8379/g.18307 Transcript_8379/m.18307 type:complete len:1795 (+) Transcript_8379:179-5563(+)